MMKILSIFVAFLENMNFNESWKEVVEKNPTEKIMQIAEAVNSFFVAFPYYMETRRQVALLYVAVWKGNLDLCKNIIKIE